MNKPLDPARSVCPALPMASMTQAQQAAAQALIDGPRGAVFGPFIPLLRSPALMSGCKKLANTCVLTAY